MMKIVFQFVYIFLTILVLSSTCFAQIAIEGAGDIAGDWCTEPVLEMCECRVLSSHRGLHLYQCLPDSETIQRCDALYEVLSEPCRDISDPELKAFCEQCASNAKASCYGCREYHSLTWESYPGEGRPRPRDLTEIFPPKKL